MKKSMYEVKLSFDSPGAQFWRGTSWEVQAVNKRAAIAGARLSHAREGGNAKGGKWTARKL